MKHALQGQGLSDVDLGNGDCDRSEQKFTNLDHGSVGQRHCEEAPTQPTHAYELIRKVQYSASRDYTYRLLKTTIGGETSRCNTQTT